MFKSRKAQIGGLAAFAGIVIVLILLAPIMLKLATSILGTTSNTLATIDTTNRSSNVVTFTQGKITGTMDWVVMFLIFINILILLVSAFMIDVNPAFVVIYIIGAFVLVISAPFSISAAEKLYSMPTFATSISFIPMTEFLMNNFGVFIVGVMVLSGIIIFAKTTMFAQGGAGATY